MNKARGLKIYGIEQAMYCGFPAACISIIITSHVHNNVVFRSGMYFPIIFGICIVFIAIVAVFC